MIFYNQDREVISDFIAYEPRTCFLMTQLGLPIPKVVEEIRHALSFELQNRNINELDANSYIKGKDFLGKIWKQIMAVPMGIAIVTNEMKTATLANIFYEIGVLNALGKDSIIIKTPDFAIPSDFVRTEYIDYDENFSKKINQFFDQVFDLADHYDTMAESLEENPLLSIDYYRRAYLITGNDEYFRKAEELFKKNKFDAQSRHFIKNFLSTEKSLKKRVTKK